MTTLPFPKLPDGSFDPETNRLMGDAFEAIRGSLVTFGSPLAYVDAALRIIDAVRAGERDPARLRAAGLAPRARNVA